MIVTLWKKSSSTKQQLHHTLFYKSIIKLTKICSSSQFFLVVHKVFSETISKVAATKQIISMEATTKQTIRVDVHYYI